MNFLLLGQLNRDEQNFSSFISENFAFDFALCLLFMIFVKYMDFNI